LFLGVSENAFRAEFPVKVQIASSDTSDRTATVTGTFLGPAR
jgi:hypothetical protein